MADGWMEHLSAVVAINLAEVPFATPQAAGF